MNLLALVQNTWRESGSGGVMPTAVTGLRGENLRILEWVWSADLFIQSMHTDWGFLWFEDQLVTAPGINVYEPAFGLAQPEEETFFLEDTPIEVFHHVDVRGRPKDRTPGRPWSVILRPYGTFFVQGTPDDVYTIDYSYYRLPVPMDIEDPEALSVIPVAYSEAIVGKALMTYAEYENAPETMQKGQTMFDNWIAACESTQLPGDRKAHRTAEGNRLEMHVE